MFEIDWNEAAVEIIGLSNVYLQIDYLVFQEEFELFKAFKPKQSQLNELKQLLDDMANAQVEINELVAQTKESKPTN